MPRWPCRSSLEREGATASGKVRARLPSATLRNARDFWLPSAGQRKLSRGRSLPPLSCSPPMPAMAFFNRTSSTGPLASLRSRGPACGFLLTSCSRRCGLSLQ